MADGFVLGGEDGGGYWVGSYLSAAEGLRRRLEAYIVADDVTVDDRTEGWMGVSLLGEGAGAWLSSEAREGMVFPGRRSSAENWEWVFPSRLLPAVKALLAGCPEASPVDMERRRIEAGIPSVPADIGPGDLPHEGGLFAVAVSTTKGCYLGQEVMARIKTRGTLRRRLARVSGPGPVPALPAWLWQGSRRVGQIRSAAEMSGNGGYIGLAMLPSGIPGGGAAFSLAEGAGPAVHAAG
jgi:folate-binding protein YgfZ